MECGWGGFFSRVIVQSERKRVGGNPFFEFMLVEVHVKGIFGTSK